MRELDHAVLERRLRHTLTIHLGALPLELDAEMLVRRLHDRQRARHRRYLLGLGLAAALILPAGWLAAGAMAPTNDPVVIVTPTERPVETPVETTKPGSDQAIFLRPAEDPTGAMDVIAVRADGQERLVRRLESTTPYSPYGAAARDGWLSVDVSTGGNKVHQGTWALVDLADPDREPRLVPYTPVIGGAWSGTGWFATITPSTNTCCSVDVIEAQTGATRTLGPQLLPGGGPSLFWAADGSGIVVSRAGNWPGIRPLDGGPVRNITTLADRTGGRWLGPGGVNIIKCSAPDCPTDRVSVHGDTWYAGTIADAKLYDASFDEDGATIWLLLDRVVDSRHRAVVAHVEEPGATPVEVASVDLGPGVDQMWFSGLSRGPEPLFAVGSWVRVGVFEPADGPTAILSGSNSAASLHEGRFVGFVPGPAADTWPGGGAFERVPDAPIPTAPASTQLPDGTSDLSATRVVP